MFFLLLIHLTRKRLEMDVLILFTHSTQIKGMISAKNNRPSSVFMQHSLIAQPETHRSDRIPQLLEMQFKGMGGCGDVRV
jgi:hypothetical protein